jgi:hypothetical protein
MKAKVDFKMLKTISMKKMSSDEDEDSFLRCIPATTEIQKVIPSSEINENDVLCGRGEATRRNLGNRRFRDLVVMNQKEYLTSNILEKGLIADKIVEIIENRVPSGRFLKAVQEGNHPTSEKDILWYQVSSHAAKVKTSQALRERNPELCKAQDSEVLENDIRHSLLLSRQDSLSVNNGGYHQHVKLVIASLNVATAPNCGTPTSMISDSDVLCGRGAITNYHVGNVRFRNLVKSYKPQYLAAPKLQKAAIAQQIVNIIRTTNPPGKFLQQNSANGCWNEISNEKAREKTSQALREGTAEVKGLYSVKANMDAASLAACNFIEGHKGFLQPPCNITSMPIIHTQISDSLHAPIPLCPQYQHMENGYKEGQEIHQELLPKPFQLRTTLLPSDSSNQCLPQCDRSQHFESSQPFQMLTNDLNRSRFQDKVSQVSENDVLFGRGAAVNFHVGNLRFRKLVNQYRSTYLNAPKIEKAAIAKTIVEKIWNANPPGRFLCKDSPIQDSWVEVDERRAREKASQALRENIMKDSKAKRSLNSLRQKICAREALAQSLN